MNRRSLFAAVAGMFGLLIGRKVVARESKPVVIETTFTFNDYVLVPIDRRDGKPPSLLIWKESEKRYVNAAENQGLIEYFRESARLELARMPPEKRERLLAGEWRVSTFHA